MNFRKNYELTFNKILAIIIAILVFVWMIQEEPEIEEPIITISHKCKMALRSPYNIPEHVKKQCIELLKDQNEIESD